MARHIEVYADMDQWTEIRRRVLAGEHSLTVFHGLRGWPGWVYRGSKMMIVMTNTKGSVGKSTLAAHLPIWLFDQGRKAALLDTDEQATATGWIERAENGITVANATTVDAIRQEWKKLQSSHEFIVADSPGSGEEAAQAITLLADIALIPL
jgi:septum formation inhibitor-activating ATPase MinD